MITTNDVALRWLDVLLAIHVMWLMFLFVWSVVRGRL